MSGATGENYTVETLPDEDNIVGGEGGNAFDEDVLLGGDMGSGGPAPQDPPVQPVAPQPATSAQVPQTHQPAPVQDPAISTAFAEQRRYYEGALNQLQMQLLALQTQVVQAQPAPVPVPEPVDPQPDPVDNPAEFAAWAVRQAEKNVMAKIAPDLAQVQQVQAATQAQTRESAYVGSLAAAEARYGKETWAQLYAAAGQFATEFPSARQDVFSAADPGEALARLGARALGMNGAPAPVTTTQTPTPAPQTQQLSEAQIRADERAKATRDLMSQFQNPYNLAPPSIGGINPATVTSGGLPVVGSPEEEALLGS